MQRLKIRFNCASPAFPAACTVAQTLTESGFETGLVGGSVRDLLLGRTPDDFDLVTAARPEEALPLFPGSEVVGAAFGVMLIRYRGFHFEVASAREERSYLDGRHPEAVRYTRSLECDVLRRDFTVNALWYDPAGEEVCDCVGGLADLERGILRTVGDPDRRFEEDHLRMLRAIRFAEKLRFTLEDKTFEAIRRHAPQAVKLAGERVREELSMILTGPDPARGAELLEKTGLLHALLPEVADLRGVEQPPEFHPEGDVLTHTFLMLSHMALPDVPLAWSVLLHDVGKKETFSVDETGRIRFFSHEVAGAEIAERILNRLHFSNEEREAVTGAIRNHMRFANVTAMRRAKLRKLLAEPHFPLELELNRLDCLSCHGKMEGFLYLLDQWNEDASAGTLPEPFVRGRDLIAAGLPPSPAFSKVLDETFDRQLAGEFSDRAAALAFAAAAMKKFFRPAAKCALQATPEGRIPSQK